jgi:hypothetical protein
MFSIAVFDARRTRQHRGAGLGNDAAAPRLGAGTRQEGHVPPMSGPGPGQRPDHRPTSARPAPDQCPTSARPVPDQCRPAPDQCRPAPDQCRPVPTSARPAPDQCPTSARPAPDQCPTSARPVPDQCPTSVRPVSYQCPAVGPTVPRGMACPPRQAVTMAMTAAGVIALAAATSAVRSSCGTDARISAIRSAMAGDIG